MPPKTPSFWQEKSLAAYLLLPLSWVSRLGASAQKYFAKPYRAGIPVICVGGAVAGGSGKTPVVHALIELIRARDLYKSPVILTRGYGGQIKGPTTVDAQTHSAVDVGDEALLHAMHAQTIVSRDRAAGARLAEAAGADLIIMDDGLQNLSLVKDVSLLVVDARQGFGNGFTLPAGPLREPLPSALQKIQAVIETNGRSGNTYNDLPVVSAKYSVVSEHDKNRSYYAFAGLGVPEKFKKTLEENGFKIAGFESFADHHPYSDGDIKALVQAANGARLITTEKDFVRIPAAYKNSVDALRISAVFDNQERIVQLLP